MKPLLKSISLFEQARSAYLKQQFDAARNLITAYQQSVDYTLIPHQDRRSDKKISISVIIVSNGPQEGVGECLKTLSLQTDTDFEIILVDNTGGATDLAPPAGDCLVHLCPPVSLFCSEGWNAGAFFARGAYLVFIDGNARMDADYIKQVKHAWSCFDFSGVRGKMIWTGKGDVPSGISPPDLGEYPLPAALMPEGNRVVKKEVFFAVKGFDPLLFDGDGPEFTRHCQNKFPGQGIYYWPNLIVSQSDVSEPDLEIKARHDRLASAYGKFLAPETHNLVDMPDSRHDRAKIRRLQMQLRQIRSSAQFRLGCALKDAATSPFRNLWKLPFVLFKIALEYFNRGNPQDPVPVDIPEKRVTTPGNTPKKARIPLVSPKKKATEDPGDLPKMVPGVKLRNKKKYLHPGFEEHNFTEVENFTALKTTKNSSLRIACVLGSHLYACLDFEAELIPLTPKNWQQVLASEQPDLFMAQATRQFYTPEWQDASIWEENPGGMLEEMLAVCHKKNIPTVFWDTEYTTHFPLFAPAACLFDHIFATDIKSIDAYQRVPGCDRVTHLPLAVQPGLHNPVRQEKFLGEKRDFSILFDGWADMLEWPDKYDSLKGFLKEGLHIVESRYRFVANKLNDLPEFQENIMGHLTYGQLLSAFRSYRVCLIFADSLSTPLSLAQKAMEAVACGAVVIYNGPPNGFIPENTVFYADCDEQMKKLCEFYLKQEHPGALHTLRARRNLFSKDTYAHRLQDICRELGVNHGWEEYPLMSIVTPTKRPELISQALANYTQQNYPNTEWIIVLNTSKTAKEDIEKICQHHPSIRVFQLHEEKNIGACLNLGIEKARGVYWSKMDDDDDYGPNYILDMLLEIRGVDADIFGKPPALIYLEEKDELFLRTKGLTSQYIQGENNIPLICGATISGRTKNLPKIMFSEDMRACVDTDFLRLCKQAGLKTYLSSVYGFSVMRRKEKSLHTWRLDDTALRRHSICVGKKTDVEKMMA